MEERKNEKERFFSVELVSKSNLKNVTLTNSEKESVLVEGTIGNLKRACFQEGVVLEVVGTKGVVRINLTEKEIGSCKEEKSNDDSNVV